MIAYKLNSIALRIIPIMFIAYHFNVRIATRV